MKYLRSFALLALAALSGHASTLLMVLAPAQQIGIPGAQVLFQGTIYNPTDITVYLTSGQVSIASPDLLGDPTPLLINAPLFLDPGEDPGLIDLFTVQIADPFLSGNGIYAGTLNVLSGAAPDGREFLDSVDFGVQVGTRTGLSGPYRIADRDWSGLETPWCKALALCWTPVDCEWRLVAGAYREVIHNALGALLIRRWTLPKNGRRPLQRTR